MCVCALLIACDGIGKDSVLGGSSHGKEESGYWLTKHHVPKLSYKRTNSSVRRIDISSSDESSSSASLSPPPSPLSRSQADSLRRCQDSSQSKQSREISLSSDSSDSSCVIVDSQNADVVSFRPGLGADGTMLEEGVSTSVQKSASAGGFYGNRNRASVSRHKSWEEKLDNLDRLASGTCSDSDSEDYSIQQKTAVLEFLNGCGQQDLAHIPGCSSHKAKMLTEIGPFEDWPTMVGKTRE